MDVEAVIPQGRIRGRRAAGVRSFFAIPYAAPPYGAHRFRAPQPPARWSDIRDCTTYGPTALKPPQPDVFEELLPDPDIAGEDCLTVNVWTPDDATDLPVLVWVHGGGYLTGSGAVPIYDGTAFARDGVVCVTLNYRLGVDGFAQLPNRPPNRGLLDVIAALEWVRENIAALGGDPTRVTLAGQSAGAMAVTTLLSMPRAQGLFVRVIAESGAGNHALTVHTAEHVTAALCRDLQVAPEADALAAVPMAALMAAVDALIARLPTDPDPRWDEVRQKAMVFQPVIDGSTLPALPIEGLQAGVGADLDLLTGTNTDEFTLWAVPTGLADALDDDALAGLLAALGADPPTAIEAYAAEGIGKSAALLYCDVMTDSAFWLPAIRAAEARSAGPGRTFIYEFTWPSPLYDGRLGATHALEVAFAFDNLSVDWARPLRGAHAPQSLADDLHGAFVAFIRDGDPGWSPYAQTREVGTFGAVRGVSIDPRARRRQTWAHGSLDAKR
ncbi:carboxylesterase family protein [Jatrophihabitans cynanchi]|uniref:Carboxylesterase family protein n=1 Tax=Jatrophihabitans cynanchi TaxID=2944128 RepID=A0ABY7K683_9ACTN|nr:carboxylesterase family protein [Jatrophihabitans sp. SB3-54]WAX59027.1 carboxylesterase family protein [Jatrophihabitans sp. SB3-54]